MIRRTKPARLVENDPYETGRAAQLLIGLDNGTIDAKFLLGAGAALLAISIIAVHGILAIGYFIRLQPGAPWRPLGGVSLYARRLVF